MTAPVRTETPQTTRERRADSNRLESEDRPAHDWYRFVLSFPPHLVRDYLERFELERGACVLDPFCGTGTTVVECRKLGMHGIGIEAHPMSHFASSTKVDWSPEPDDLENIAAQVAERALDRLDAAGIVDHPQPELRHENPARAPLESLPASAEKLLLANSISPLPLHKTLVLLDEIDRASKFQAHMRLGLARCLVNSISNLHFGPEVGVGPPKEDAAVVSTWLAQLRRMAHDLRSLHPLDRPPARVERADSRELTARVRKGSVDAVFTSPPYPNEKDYTRTTRLESVILGFIRDRAELRSLKRTMLRSNTRGVYKEDADDALGRRTLGNRTHRGGNRTPPDRTRQNQRIRAPLRTRDEALFRRHGPPFRGTPPGAPPWRMPWLRRRRPGLLPPRHDPHRSDSRHDRRIARLRGPRPRPLPHPPRHRHSRTVAQRRFSSCGGRGDGAGERARCHGHRNTLSGCRAGCGTDAGRFQFF